MNFQVAWFTNTSQVAVKIMTAHDLHSVCEIFFEQPLKLPKGLRLSLIKNVNINHGLLESPVPMFLIVP